MIGLVFRISSPSWDPSHFPSSMRAATDRATLAVASSAVWTAEGGDRAEETQSLITKSHLDWNNNILRQNKVRLAPTPRDAGVSENCAEQVTCRRISFQNHLPVNT